MNRQIKEVLSRELSIDFAELENKTVVLRVDLNSPVKNGKPVINKRIIKHAKTIKMLSDENAKVVVLSHQGRKGRSDFISLREHARIISEIIEKDILFCTWEENFVEKISSLEKGEIIMLENTRFLPFETSEENAEMHATQAVIKDIAKIANIFILDALSVAHRKHATVVGFIPLLMSYIGPVLEEELKAIDKALSFEEKPVFCLGGAKPEDTVKVVKKLLEKNISKRILLCGIPGELLISSLGYDLGMKKEFFEEKGYVELLKDYKSISDRTEFPLDIAFEEKYERVERKLPFLPGKGLSLDIGEVTASYFSEIIKKECVILNGPAGVYEKPEFSFGTKKLLDSASCSKHALLGGGDTSNAALNLGFKESDFDYMSLSGKAFLKAVSLESLAALEALLTFSSNRK